MQKPSFQFLHANDCSSLVSDGGAVMTSLHGGVAARLKEVNPRLITMHCLCHNSPKRTAMYLKVQINMKYLVLSDTSKKVVAKKFKKACQTRWLSFDAATRAIHDDFLALQQTLRQHKDNDAVACGLLSKINSSKFIGTIYILKVILPVVASLRPFSEDR